MSPASRSTAPCESVGLRMFGWEAELRTDVPAVAAYGRDLFARFAAAVDRPAYRLEILTAGPGAWQVRDGAIDGHVDREDWLTGIVAARVLENVANAVDDLDLFHGAGLARGERGLVICGESGHGKSTTTLALLRRGWSFLTDECAALESAAAGAPRLRAFPKALEIRPGSPAIEGLTSLGAPRRGGKLLIDPDALFPGCVRESCPLHAIVFLASADDEPTAGPLRLTVHRRDESFLERLRQLAGIAGADWDGEELGHPVVALSGPRSTLPLTAIEDVAGACGVLILASSAEAPPPSRFDRSPRLTRLDRAAGIQSLLAQFRGRRAFGQRVERHGGFPQLFVSMLERYAPVHFLRLQVGRLDETVERLETFFDAP